MTTETIEAAIIVRATARAKETGVEARLADRLADRELRGVLRNFATEAQREAIDLRRSFLEAAAVCALLVDHPADVVSRAERAIRGIDPADVRALRQIAQAIATPVARSTDPDLRRVDGVAKRRVWESSPSGDALELLGFVRLDHSSVSSGREAFLCVTARGELLIEILRDWK
ncbi:MAG: hypothetical protein ACHREM_12615 [Polyangiales bacterium]